MAGDAARKELCALVGIAFGKNLPRRQRQKNQRKFNGSQHVGFS
jgi:hypothetical protein